jgi:hypothetical protein
MSTREKDLGKIKGSAGKKSDKDISKFKKELGTKKPKKSFSEKERKMLEMELSKKVKTPLKGRKKT